MHRGGVGGSSFFQMLQNADILAKGFGQGTDPNPADLGHRTDPNPADLGTLGCLILTQEDQCSKTAAGAARKL